jgi:uncharacterized protein
MTIPTIGQDADARGTDKSANVFGSIAENFGRAAAGSGGQRRVREEGTSRRMAGITLQSSIRISRNSPRQRRNEAGEEAGLKTMPVPEGSDVPSQEIPQPSAMPVQPRERIAAVDVLRGVAVLGILSVNILGFAWPAAAYDNPRAGGNTSTLDLVVWALNYVIINGKMMTIFSMLFGAGLVLMSERNDARGVPFTGIYFRRITWLLLIGLAHAYLLWHGDVLAVYAECGFFLYMFRRLRARTLIVIGAVCAVAVIFLISEEHYRALQRPAREALSSVMESLNLNSSPEPELESERFAREIDVHRGDYSGIFRQRIPRLLAEMTVGFVFIAMWAVGGRMLLGMGLMKLDVFSAGRSQRFYWWMIGLGYAVGLPVTIYDTWLRIVNDFEGAEMLRTSLLCSYLSAFPLALGDVGIVMLIYRSGAVPWLTRRLAAVGRMALSNYLMQSLICTTLFYGYGFGLFGHVHRPGLAAIVVAVWIFQLSVSNIWLRYFRFGPAEWLWRSLTYWKLQPMLVRPP